CFLKATIQLREPELKDKMLVTFNNKAGFDTLLLTSFTNWNNAKFVEYISRRITHPEPQRQLYVRNIPLFFKKTDIDRAFRAAGSIEKISLFTRGYFQHAIVTFTSPEAVQPYYNEFWQIFVQGHAIRAEPFDLSREVNA